MTVATDDEVERAAREVSQSLVGQQFGSSTVRSASFALQTDADDDEAVYFEVKMAEPPAGAETWPPEDLKQLRTFYRQRLAEHRIPRVTYLRIVSEYPHEPLPEDEPATRTGG